ncbi:transposase [Gammaproteobacteria bacterium]
MKLTMEAFEKIEGLFPRQRGNVKFFTFSVLTAMLHVMENGCRWRGLPQESGNWHTIHTRAGRWSKNGVPDRILSVLRTESIVRIDHILLDSTIIKVHPDGTGALKRNGPQSIGKTCGGHTTKINTIAIDDKKSLDFSLSCGQSPDAPEGRKLLDKLNGKNLEGVPVIMDRAYEDNKTGELVSNPGMKPVVPPKRNRIVKWEYDREMYKKRNEVERLFRRLKRFRRIFTGFDKLDVMFNFFVTFGLILDMIN